MRYYSNTVNGYIDSISTNCGKTEITKEEYDNIMNVIKNRPIAKEGYGYMLRTDLTWEEYELPTIIEEEVV